MAVDALGRPLKLILTPGQRGDAPLAPALLTGLSPRRVLADKAYDSNAIRALVAEGHWSQKGTGRRRALVAEGHWPQTSAPRR